MNALSYFKIKLATALLTLALCATDAAAMGSASSSASSSATGTPTTTKCKASADDKKMSVCEQLCVRKGNALHALLYDELDPMPPELILIIEGYDHHKLKCTCVHNIKGDRLTGFTILSDQYLVTAHDSKSSNENLRIWDIQTGQNITTVNEAGNFRCLTPLAEGRIATIYNGNFIVILNPQAERTERFEKILHDNQTSATTIVSLKQLSNGLLASGDRSHNIKIWNPESKQCLDTLTSNNGAVRCLSQCANGLLISGSSYPGDIKAWDLAGDHKECTQTYSPADRIKGGNGCSVNCLTVLSNDCVAAGTDAGTIVVWDPITNDSKLINSAAFTDDKKPTPYYSITILTNGYLAAGTFYGTIHIIDPLTGELVAQLKHSENSQNGENPVNFLCTAPNGWLISGSMDGVIKIWK
jgi:WD40 repeat protein